MYNNKIINRCQLRRAERSLHFAPILTNFSIFIILRPRPRTYVSTSPLLLLQLHQQHQLLAINIINSTDHLQHVKLRILLQHLTSHAAYERSGGPPKRPAAKRPCIVNIIIVIFIIVISVVNIIIPIVFRAPFPLVEAPPPPARGQ